MSNLNISGRALSDDGNEKLLDILCKFAGFNFIHFKPDF